MPGSNSSGEMSFDRTLEALESIENRQVEVLIKEIWESNSTIIWNTGFGSGKFSRELGMFRFLQRLTEKALKRITNFDFIIRLHMPSILEPNNRTEDDLNIINRRVLQAIADALNLMDKDNSKLRKQKTELEEEAYYTYSTINKQKESELIKQMKAKIYQTLKGRRYLLVTEELDKEINDPRLSWLMEVWLPGNRFKPDRALNDDCWWLITLSSEGKYNENQGDVLLDLGDLVDRYDQVFAPMFIFEQELYVAAKSISSSCCMELRRIMDILWGCLLYTLLVQYDKDFTSWGRVIETKELIQMWISEGLPSRDIKLRHVGSASLAEELDVLTSFDEEGGEESEEEKDSLTNDRYSRLFGLAEMIFKAITTYFNNKKTPFSFDGIRALLNKWKYLYKGYNMNLNHWLSHRWGLEKTDDVNDIVNPIKWINEASWISTDHSMKVKWMLHSKSNNTTTIYLPTCMSMSYPFKPDAGLFCNLSYLRVLKLEWVAINYLWESLSGLTNLRFLSIRCCFELRSPGTVSDSISFPSDSLEKLEVLDLVGVHTLLKKEPYLKHCYQDLEIHCLKELPDDLGNKKHKLYFLRISDHEIKSLPSNLFNDMPNLRELVLDGSKSLTWLSPLVSLTNLETLSLSNTNLVSLPPNTFEKMQRLRVLKITDNPLLETLPKSLCDAKRLEELELRDCGGLKAIDAHPTRNLQVFTFDGRNDLIQSLPESLARSYVLREVRISGCTSLKEIKMNGNISIRSFFLSNSSITSLSLCGCRELAKIDLKNLKELLDLNLSGTSITEIPDISDCSKLTKLDLRAVPNMRRTPWHKLHIPEMLNLDQCDFTDLIINGLDAHGKITQGKLSPEMEVGVCICVRDSHLFLNLDHKLSTNLLNI